MFAEYQQQCCAQLVAAHVNDISVPRVTAASTFGFSVMYSLTRQLWHTQALLFCSVLLQQLQLCRTDLFPFGLQAIQQGC
jgi:hypothetical protein